MYTPRQRCITILYQAIENTAANTIYGTYTWCMMGRMDVIQWNSCILVGCIFYGMVYRDGGTKLGFAVLQYWTIFLRYFGNFNLEMWYCDILRTCGFLALSSNISRVFHNALLEKDKIFLLIIGQHANACYLFCLNQRLPDITFINNLLIVISVLLTL